MSCYYYSQITATQWLTDDGKDDDGRKHGREEVGQRDEDGVAVAMVTNRIVRREGDQSAESQS